MFKISDNIESKYLQFFAPLFFEFDKKETNLVYNLNLKLKILFISITAIEVLKNIILVSLPLKNGVRYYLSDYYVTDNENQHILEFIVGLALFSFLIYLIFLCNLRQTSLRWFDFLLLYKNPSKYSEVNNIRLTATKSIYFLIRILMLLSRISSIVYLFVTYIFFIRSIILSLNKNLELMKLFICLIPTCVISAFSIAYFYLSITKSCCVFVLCNFFMAEKMNKFSEDLINFCKTKCNKTFIFKHLDGVNNFLVDFERSQRYFSYSNQSFLIIKII